tara:strand:+ start:137 stop:1114 length:978 start_codon:yes stop_codon:yes gene_type:complete
MLRSLSIIFLIAGLLLPSEAQESSDLKILVIVGASGTDDFGEIFAETALKWKEAAVRGRADIQIIGKSPDKVADGETHQDAELLRQAIKDTTTPELWIVLIGHGTFDSRSAKFNARGPDFTDSELAAWVVDYQGELTVINTASASGSFISRLSAPNRIIITANKNEGEIFYTRFGGYFAEAVGGLPDADLDNDDQVSLLESFLYASDRVAEFYESEGRLSTEHALLDDNGDLQGSRSEWFDGTTATETPGKDAEPDGERAGQKVLVKNDFERRLTQEQRSQRDKLERDVKQLRRNRDSLQEDDYYAQLETLLLQLARIYEEVGDS